MQPHLGFPQMVRSDNWQEKWFGKLNKALFAIVMLSDPYWLSGAIHSCQE
jgi:hypothetical protein